MDDVIRNATLSDLAGIMEVETSWPEGSRATEDKFTARLEKFPEGFYVTERDDRLIATITACPCCYDPTDLALFSSWDAATNEGYLYQVGTTENYNALYIVSGVIAKGERGGDIFERMINVEVELARSLGMHFVIAGAVIPGYAKYREKHGSVSAEDYVFLRRGSHPFDPLLSKYDGIGFVVPDKKHVLPDYFPDLASLNYAALVVREL